MQTERLHLTTFGLLLGLAPLAACDSAPTEAPAYDAAQAAIEFALLEPEGSAADTVEHETACPSGGTFAARFAVSSDQDGDITIRRIELDRRYHECRMSSSLGNFTINGQLTWSGEQHLGAPREQPQLLLQKGHQVGTVIVTRNGTEIRNCEYDVEEVVEPPTGRFSMKGTVCGTPVDVQRRLPVWAISS